jgi:hypothetical protein
MSGATQPYFQMRRGYDWKVVVQTFVMVMSLLSFVWYGGKLVNRLENIEGQMQQQRVDDARRYDQTNQRLDRVEDRLLDLYDRSIKR